MAGSCAEVLLPCPLSEGERRELQEFILAVSSEQDGQAFWIAGQPFHSYQTDEDLPSHSPMGWVPRQAIGFCAGCRGQAGDLFLAMLVIRVAEMFGGLIGLGGSIASVTADPSVLSLEGCYPSESGDILTPTFLRHWVGHPHFKMVN
jgi:hypothetical protein